MKFIKLNWQTFLFPISLLFIFLFDRVVGFSYSITIIKILVISILHMFLVYKTKYIYKSEIYEYYVELDAEFQKGFILSPLIPRNQKNITFFSIFFVGIFLTLTLDMELEYSYHLCIFLCIACILFVIDFCYEILRVKTNRMDFNLTRIKLPSSLTTQRYMFTVATQKLVQYGPLCVQAIKGIVTMGIATEVGLPTLTGGPNNIGPLTSLYVNKIEYPYVQVPIETRTDIIYEHAYKGYDNDVARGYIDENPLKPRKGSIRSFSQLAKMGLDMEPYKK